MSNSWNICFWEYHFLAPNYLYLLLVVPLLLFLFFWLDHRVPGELAFTGKKKQFSKLKNKTVPVLRISIITLYFLALCLLVVALAKPLKWDSYTKNQYNYVNGIDIVIAMDISLSMMARDFEPNRLEASKKVAKEFIDSREGDRIGLVVYEGEAYTASPLTLDYESVKSRIDSLQPGLLEGGTAIGTGLGTAITRLRNDSLPSKVVILLTDGVNNQGEISPEMAAEIALEKKIRVYTIGVGSLGMAPSPVFTPFGVRYENMPVEIDEITLSKISRITKGKYFRATDENSLRSIYKEIDLLEKKRFKQLDNKLEIPIHPMPFIRWAILLMSLGFLVQLILFRSND